MSRTGFKALILSRDYLVALEIQRILEEVFGIACAIGREAVGVSGMSDWDVVFVDAGECLAFPEWAAASGHPRLIIIDPPPDLLSGCPSLPLPFSDSDIWNAIATATLPDAWKSTGERS